MTRCSTCGVSKTRGAFGLQKTGQGTYRLRTSCKDCRGAYEKKRYETKSEAAKLRARDRCLQKLYGISLNDYNELFATQKGMCPACGKHQGEFDKSLVVDHDHDTGKVRGLLCSGCNLALGNVKENIETLYGSVEYLKKVA